MHKPLQERSRKTLDRLVLAAEKLLESKNWSDIGIADISTTSQVSVGSFYARFSDKEALLDYLDDRYTEEIQSRIEQNASSIVKASSLTLAATTLTDNIFDFFSSKKGLVRALVMRAREGDKGAALRTQRMTAALPQIIDAFETHREEIVHVDWRQAVSEAIAVASHSIREQLLFPQSLALKLPEERLRSLLARFLVSHLTTPEER